MRRVPLYPTALSHASILQTTHCINNNSLLTNVDNVKGNVFDHFVVMFADRNIVKISTLKIDIIKDTCFIHVQVYIGRYRVYKGEV